MSSRVADPGRVFARVHASVFRYARNLEQTRPSFQNEAGVDQGSFWIASELPPEVARGS